MVVDTCSGLVKGGVRARCSTPPAPARVSVGSPQLLALGSGDEERSSPLSFAAYPRALGPLARRNFSYAAAAVRVNLR